MEAERIPLTQLDFTTMRKDKAQPASQTSGLLHPGKADDDTHRLRIESDTGSDAGGPVAYPRKYRYGKTSDLATNVDDMVEVMGTGSFHMVSVAICGLGNAADAVELLCIGYILPALEAQGEVIDPDSSDWKFQKSFLSAAVFAGMLVGGVLAGVGADSLGRKPMLMASLGVNAVFGVISAFTPTGWWPLLAACRICSGIGVGGSIPSVFTLFSEYLPVKGRGFWLSVVAWFWMIGSIYAAGSAWVLIGILKTDWRIFAVVCAIPAAVAFFLSLLLLPESPRYLASKGRLDAARDVLLYMGRWNGVLNKPAFVLANGGFLVKEGCVPSMPVTLTDAAVAALPRTGAEEAAQVAPATTLHDSDYDDDDDAGAPTSGSDDATPTGRADRFSSRASSVFVTDASDPPGLPVGPSETIAFRASRGVSDDARSAHAEAVAAAAAAAASSASSPAPPRSLCARIGGGVAKSLSDFLHPSIRRTSLLLIVCWFTLSFGWYGLILWIPTLFAKQDFDLDPYQDAFLVSAANLPGNILAAWLMDRIGRRFLLGGGMLLASALAVVFAFSRTAALTVATACLLNMVSVGGWNSLDCLSTESFPTTLRTSAMGYLSGMGRLVSQRHLSQLCRAVSYSDAGEMLQAFHAS